MKTSEILGKAADHIARYGWIQDDWWDADTPTVWTKCKVCAGGGINAAAGYIPDYDEHDGANEALETAFEALAMRVDPSLDGATNYHISEFIDAVAHWNDAKGRTAEQVIAELRAAAASEREAGR